MQEFPYSIRPPKGNFGSISFKFIMGPKQYKIKEMRFFFSYLTKNLALEPQKFLEFHSISGRSFSTVHSSIMMQIFCIFLHNLVMKEVYRVVYHILLFVIVKNDCFSIDFHF